MLHNKHGGDRMKKIILLFLLVGLTFTGCTQDGEGNGETTKSDGFAFQVENIVIDLHAEAAPILEALGDPMDSFEAPSCAFNGMDRVYVYSGFEIHTYEDQGKDYVSAIILLDDSVSTKEGIYLYSSLEEVLDVYGSNYTKNFDLYTFERAKSKITFLFQDNQLISIEYIAKAF